MDRNKYVNITDKEAARIKFLNLRKRLQSSEISYRSRLIAENLFHLEIFTRSKDIALYSPIKNEVETILIHNKSRELGKNVYYPRVSGDLLTFHRIDDISELKTGTYGLLQPESAEAGVSLFNIDLFVHPGLCFDLCGNRIGYGNGYYDRTLQLIKKNKKLGLAYDFQIVNSINADINDKAVSCIVTEKNVYHAIEGGH